MLSLNSFLEKSDGKLKISNEFELKAKESLTEKLTICIPDTHLLEKGPNDHFYGQSPQNEKSFEDLLYFLLKLKGEEKEFLEIIQLGDMYDLWLARGNTNLIEAAYPNILGLLSELKTICVIGNHDIDLVRLYRDGTSEREWRFFSENTNGRKRVIFEHGFQADFYNNQDSWSGAIGRKVTEIVGVMQYIDPNIDVILGGTWDSVSRVFTIYNGGLSAAKNPDGFNTHEYINYYIDLMEKYNRGDTDDHHDPTDLELTVIGHTHSPRLVKKPKNDREYFLMDCGSWVNGRRDIGVISGNDMAICRWE